MGPSVTTGMARNLTPNPPPCKNSNAKHVHGVPRELSKAFPYGMLSRDRNLTIPAGTVICLVQGLVCGQSPEGPCSLYQEAIKKLYGANETPRPPSTDCSHAQGPPVTHTAFPSVHERSSVKDGWGSSLLFCSPKV